MGKWLKKMPAKRSCIEGKTNNVHTSEKEHGRAVTSPAPSMRSWTAALQGENNGNLI